MQALDLAGANDDFGVTRIPLGHDDDLLSDFRQRLDRALKMLRDHEDATRPGEVL